MKNNLIIPEYSLIYDKYGNILNITFDTFFEDPFRLFADPDFFINNISQIDNFKKMKISCIKEDIVNDHYQNESGAAYICFIAIITFATRNMIYNSEFMNDPQARNKISNHIATTLKLLPAVLYDSKYGNYLKKNKPERPKGNIARYSKLPSGIKKIFNDSASQFYWIYYGINKGFYKLKKYDPTMRKKQAALLNPIFDSMNHVIRPVFRN